VAGGTERELSLRVVSYMVCAGQRFQGKQKLTLAWLRYNAQLQMLQLEALWQQSPQKNSMQDDMQAFLR